MSEQINTDEALAKFSSGELGNVKVMMIEDDTFFSELVLSKLSKEGCIPYSSNNGDEAIAMAEQFQPNLILLDLMLPGAQGEEVLSELKAHGTLNNIPVIIFSNKSDGKDIDENMKAGAAAFLVKSATELSDLVDIVKKVLKDAGVV